MSGGEYGDQRILLRSNSSSSEGDLEGQRLTPRVSNKGIKDLIKRLDRGFSFNRRQSIKRSDRDQPQPSSSDHGNGIGGDEILGESAPPEWALLLIGCLLGLATGLSVAGFNRGVSLLAFSCIY